MRQRCVHDFVQSAVRESVVKLRLAEGTLLGSAFSPNHRTNSAGTPRHDTSRIPFRDSGRNLGKSGHTEPARGSLEGAPYAKKVARYLVAHEPSLNTKNASRRLSTTALTTRRGVSCTRRGTWAFLNRAHIGEHASAPDSLCANARTQRQGEGNVKALPKRLRGPLVASLAGGR